MKKYIIKALSALSLLVFLTLLFCGCAKGNEANPQMKIDYVKRADGSSYAIYNGEAQEFFGVEEGKENVVDVTVNKESGNIRILIHKENDPESIVYDGHDFSTEHFTVTVNESGRYRILVQAEEFIGSYKFSYDMGQ